MKSNVLVTGAAGFIGSHLARLLVNSRYKVTILDKMTYASDIRRIEDIKDRVKLYMGDICDRELVENVIKENNIDCIVNMAAETMVDRSIKNIKPFVHSNIGGVQNLLDIVRKNKENGYNIRFVQISTDEVYGSTKWNDESFKETDKLNPGNPYAASKASADLLCLAYKNTFDIDVIITRSSNNYGPWQDKEKFIPRMISLAMEGKDLEIYGNGQNVRDWLWVEDNCHAIKKVMEEGRSSDIYNISSYEEKTNNQVAKIIADRFGVGIKYVEDRKGHDFHYSINCDKITKELGWKVKISFEEGIEKTIDFYKNQYQSD